MTVKDWVPSLVSNSAVFANWAAILRYGATIAGRGHYCEFGVYQGSSLQTLCAVRPDVVFHGFDSFRGLPEAGRRHWPKGLFDREGVAPPVPENARLHVGWFQDTIPEFLEEYPGPITFLNVDCDLESSTRTVLRSLNNRIRPGTIIKFDEFWGFDTWDQSSEAKATLEWCQEFGRDVECLGTQEEKVLLRVTA